MKDLLPILVRCKCVVNSTNVRAFQRFRNIPDKFILDEMYSKTKYSNGVKLCKLAYHCIPKRCNNLHDLVYPVNEKGCLSEEYVKKRKCKENERPFQVGYSH